MTSFPVTCVTVSPVGLSSGYLPNNGANYGPDTPGTTTNGIQEALNFAASVGGARVFCQAGAYSCSTGFWFPGNNILVVFAPGSSLTFPSGATGLTPNYVTGAPFPAFILMGTSLSSNPSAPLSHQWLVGNGLAISWDDQSISGVVIYNPGQANTNGVQVYSGPGGEDYLVEGLETSGVVNQVFVAGTLNTASPMSAVQHMRHVVFRGIYDTRGANTGGTGIHIAGGVMHALVEDCESDLSATTGNISNLFMNASTGDTSYVVWRNCRIRNHGNGQVFELQGNGAGVGGTTGGTHHILLEDCVFDSGGSAPVINGSGGGYMDDTDGGTGTGFVYNIEFRRCLFVNCAVGLSAAGSEFGYLRFSDCQPSTSVTYPNGFSGTLTGRGPNDPGVSVSPTGSPYTYTNLDGFDEMLLVSGGTLTTDISHNGKSTGLNGGMFRLRAADTLSFDYTTAPTIYKQAL